MQFPRKDGTTTGQNTGVTTPKRNAIPMTPGGGGLSHSRPVSPVVASTSSELVNGSAVLAAALQKKMSRKRKVRGGFFNDSLCCPFALLTRMLRSLLLLYSSKLTAEPCRAVKYPVAGSNDPDYVPCSSGSSLISGGRVSSAHSELIDSCNPDHTRVQSFASDQQYQQQQQ